jgi:hypothetical protein
MAFGLLAVDDAVAVEEDERNGVEVYRCGH